LRNRRDFASVERFCFFFGYARSGHSVVGSLLNAHPEMVVSNELHAVRFVQHGFNRNQLFALILARDASFGEMGRKWTGYDYAVPNQHQGEFRTLRVIGDKKGGATSREFASHPGLLDRLRTVVGVPIRAVHVTRNPFDNIARMSMSGKGTDLGSMIVRYSGLCDSVSRTRKQLSAEELIDIRHEDFSRAPADFLADLCRFVGVSTSGDYLRDCASIVREPEIRPKDKVEWSAADITAVNRIIDRHPFMAGYSFDS
jgi:hypothetical protein